MVRLANFAALAQELVEASSAMLRGRTINVMDLDGVIVASTQKERIGTLHAGARLVAQREKDLAISREDLSEYPGAREGYNMPLICKGRMIGVIGIFGEPDEILDLGRLLKVYASKYFELEVSMNQKLMDAELKSRLFGLLMTAKEGEGEEEIQAVMESLGLRFSYPARALRLTREGEGQEASWGLELLEERLLEKGLLDAKKDLWGLERTAGYQPGDGERRGSMMLLKSLPADGEEAFMEGLREAAGRLAFPVKICAGKRAGSLRELKGSWRQAGWMDKHMDGRFLDLEDGRVYVEYMMERACAEHGDFLELYGKRLRERFGKEELGEHLRCALCYYEEQHSVGAAARKLFIHKNTLQYRMKRLLEAAGLEGEPEFMQEYLLRLLIKRFQKEK